MMIGCLVLIVVMRWGLDGLLGRARMDELERKIVLSLGGLRRRDGLVRLLFLGSLFNLPLSYTVLSFP